MNCILKFFFLFSLGFFFFFSGQGTQTTLRVSSRLFLKRICSANHTQPPAIPVLPSSSSATEDGISPAAKKMRRYRDKLKEKGEYEQYHQKQAEIAKKSKANRTEEKQEDQEKTRLRVQKCREKKKALGQPLNQKPPQTRAALEVTRKKERERKRGYRANVTPQKKVAVNAKGKKQAAAKREEQQQRQATTVERPPAQDHGQATQWRDHQRKIKAKQTQWRDRQRKIKAQQPQWRDHQHKTTVKQQWRDRQRKIKAKQTQWRDRQRKIKAQQPQWRDRQRKIKVKQPQWREPAQDQGQATTVERPPAQDQGQATESVEIEQQPMASSHGYSNKNTKAKAVSRAKSKMPHSPFKYAEVAEQLPTPSLPGKRRLSREKGCFPLLSTWAPLPARTATKKCKWHSRKTTKVGRLPL